MQPVRTCIALVILLWALPSHAAIFFDDSFETCSVGTGNDFPCEGWNDFGQESSDRFAVSNQSPLTGSKAIKQTWIAANGDGVQPSIYKNLPSPQDHIFIRFPTRRSAAWTQSTNGMTKLMIVGNLGYPRMMIMDSFNDYGLAVECPYNIDTSVPPNGKDTAVIFNGGGAPTAGGAYDQLEVEYKLNTPGQANGLLRMWRDGVLKIEKLNLEMRGPTPAAAAPPGCTAPASSDYKIRTIQLFTQSGVGTRISDRIAVGDTRIGPVSAQSVDTTPPGPVINFGVK